MFQRPVRGAIAALASTLVLMSGAPASAVVVDSATTATVTPTQQLTGTATPVPLHGDFDGDGRDDIFWYVAGSGTDYLWSGKPRTSTSTVDANRFDVQTIPISGSYRPAVGDFDGNGLDDIFWYGKGAAADSVWYFTGRGTISSKSFKISGDYQLHAGNFNTAGASADADDVFLYGPGYSSLWSGTTSRTFTSTNYSSPPPSGAKVYPGNWRQSSTTPGATEHLDLLFYRPGKSSDTIWVGNSTGAFTTSSVTINGNYDPIVGNFDLSSNGGPEMHDIFWYAPGTANDYVWMNTGSTFTSELEKVNGKTYKPRVLAARGADEQDDILWNNPSGTDFIWKTTGANGSYTYTSINATLTLGDPGSRTPLIADLDTGEAIASGSWAGTIDAGINNTCAVTAAGGAQCWGMNFNGILGSGIPSSNVPVDVPGLSSGVAAVTLGDSHACALTTTGGVKCWGSNSLGQLGNSTNNNSLTPVDVTGLSSGVTAIAAGDFHTCALTSAGGVKCWGFNGNGQLGNGSGTDSNVPVVVTGRTSGTASISAGSYHSCATTSAGGATCWGGNDFGQLGNGTTTPSNVPVVVTGRTSGTASIAAGQRHTCATTTGGGATCWGNNDFGQLGNGTTTSSSTQVNVSGLTSGVATITAGWDFSCATTTGGGAKCWGTNVYRNFGNGTITDSNVPVDVTGLTSGVSIIDGGAAHTCAITSAGIAKCWGYNGGVQVGDGTNDAFKATPSNVAGGSTYGAAATPAVGPNVDLLWWAPGNGATQTEILWTELESVS